jgi:hypothetical protein
VLQVHKVPLDFKGFKELQGFKGFKDSQDNKVPQGFKGLKV